jgi:hypothetical protein
MYKETIESRKQSRFVMPAEAGIQYVLDILDSGLSRGDGAGGFSGLNIFKIQK